MSLLDELKEKRQDAIENFETQGADIEVTREQLADQQRVRAFWAAQIVDLDKAISALTPEGKEALLESQPEPIPTEVRKEDEQDAAGEIISGEPFPMSDADTERSEMTMALLRGETEIQQPATPIPEGFTKWEGSGYEDAPHCKDVEVLFRDGRILRGVSGEFTWSSAQQLLDGGWKHSDADGSKIDEADDIIAYRIIETGETASELDSSQIEGGDRVELHDRPKLTDEEHNSLEKLDDKPSTVFLDQAQAAILDTNEDEPSEAAVFAHGLNIEIDQKAEAKPTFASAVAKLFQMGDA